jgi:hypothetical protein
MATINISDLRPTGSDLFFDSESYMSELADSELDIINGGFTSSPLCVATSIAISKATIQRSSAACARKGVEVSAAVSSVIASWIASPDF